LFVGSNGNVGIGTTSPSNTLHVENTTSSGAYINYDGQSNTEFGLRIESNADGGDFESDFANGSTALLDLYANSASVSGGDLLVARTQSATPVLLVKGSGNVGIGTTAPDGKLVVAGAGSQIIIDDTDATDTPRLRFRESGITSGSIFTDASDLIFDTGTTERVRITSAGNVGIGTSPSCKLDVSSGGVDKVALFKSTDSTAYVELADNTGSVQFITLSSGALRIATGGGAGGGSIGTSGLFIDQSQNVGIGDDTPSYKLDVNGTGRFVGQLTLDDELLHNISGTQTRLPGYYAGTYGVEIEQTAQGSTIHVGRSNGNCMNIGADATAAGTDVNVVYFRDTGAGVGGPPAVSTEVGKIVINTTSTNYSTSSDYRLKENEVVISDGIDRLKQLNAYRFNFIKEPSKVVDGFFAHEVSSIVPESIVGTKDEVDDDGNPVYQGIDQSKLVPLLTAALQEAVAKIEALEARVAVLEG